MASRLRGGVAALACAALLAGAPMAAADSPRVSAQDASRLVQVMPRSDLARQSVYFVMTDRYANGSRDNDLGLGDSYGGFAPSNPRAFHGGDFVGLTANLDRLKRLGFTALWITPPFLQNAVQGDTSAYHGYWGIDFTTVDPHLGTEEEFKAFVDKAHALGMRVYIDIVLNHTGDVIQYREGSSWVSTNTAPYRDADGRVVDISTVAGKPVCAGASGPDCFPRLTASSFPKRAYVPNGAPRKKPEWLNDITLYHNRGDASDCGWAGGECAEMGDFIGLDDIMTEHPTVVRGWADTLGTWVRRFGIDGFRIDTAKHVDPKFLPAWVPLMLEQAKAAGKDDFPMFGEVWDYGIASVSTYMREKDLPSVLDFPSQGTIRDFAAGRKSGNALLRGFARDDYYNGGERADGVVRNAYSLATFLGNHDMGRAATLIKGQTRATGSALVDRVRLAHTVLYLSRGAPVVYYGDEVGMMGSGGDAAARQDMFSTQVSQWRTEERLGSKPIGSASSLTTASESHPMAAHLRALQSLRATYPALRDGAFIPRGDSKGAAAWSRISPSERREFVVVVNSGDAAVTIPVITSSPNTTFSSVFGVKTSTRAAANGRISVSVPARGALVLRAAGVLPATSTAATYAAEAFHDYLIGAPVVRVPKATGTDPSSVTFVARQCASCSWVRLGTDDAAPYSLPIPRGSVDVSREFQVAAIVRTSDGRIGPGTITTVAPADVAP